MLAAIHPLAAHALNNRIGDIRAIGDTSPVNCGRTNQQRLFAIEFETGGPDPAPAPGMASRCNERSAALRKPERRISRIKRHAQRRIQSDREHGHRVALLIAGLIYLVPATEVLGELVPDLFARACLPAPRSKHSLLRRSMISAASQTDQRSAGRCC